MGEKQYTKEENSLRLYELTGQWLELSEMLLEAEEMEEQVVRDTLEAIEGEIEIKAEGYGAIIKELQAEQDKFAKEAARLDVMAKAYKNRIEWLKSSLFNTMQVMGKKKVETDHFKIAIQANGGKQPLEIDDVEIPVEFAKVTTEFDKEKVRQALEEGQELPFARLKEKGSHLVIR